MFAHAHYTKLTMCVQNNGEIKVTLYSIICLALNDIGVSQHMAFNFEPSLYQLAKHIFEILQDLVVAEIKW